MTKGDPEANTGDYVEITRTALAAALAGDVDALSPLLAEDVRWYGAGGDPNGGCTNRRQALAWLGSALARGVTAEVLEVRALGEKRVLVRLQRQPERVADPAPPPHAQIVTFRGDRVAEIVVFPSDVEALAAAQSL